MATFPDGSKNLGGGRDGHFPGSRVLGVLLGAMLAAAIGVLIWSVAFA
jgi:hypothetical protein